MSDDLSLERALIEELITIGPASIPAGDSFSHGVYCHNNYAIRGNGWLLINCRKIATWPPCSFAEFIEKLRDPKIREACGLKPLEEM